MEHLSQKQVEDFSLQQLPAAELLAVSDHLEACEACRRRVEGEIAGDSGLLALHEETFYELTPGAHLSAEQTADYVDQNLSGEVLQVVNDHLTTCDLCVLAVEDLRAFRNEVGPSLDRRFAPPGVAEASSSWREKIASLFRVGPLPAFATAALAVLFLAAIAWLVWRTPREQKQEVVAVPSPTLQPAPSVEVTPEPTAAPVVVAQLNDGGGVLSLDQEGKLTGADALPAAYQGLVKKTLSSQRIERSSQLQGLTRASSALMGSNAQAKEFAVREPVGNVLLNDKPKFSWSALEGATGYVVEVYDDQFKLVVSSPQITNLSWTSTQPLTRGKIYSWQVKATAEGAEVTAPRPPAPQAKFRVLDQARTNEIAKAKRAYASSHLTLGLLYADAGLLKEAEQQFLLLRRANPDSDLARNLLRQVQSLGR